MASRPRFFRNEDWRISAVVVLSAVAFACLSNPGLSADGSNSVQRLSSEVSYASLAVPVGASDSLNQDPAQIEMSEFLNQLPIIRVVITAANGHGHQASTVNVMRRLREIGYRGDFEVVFDPAVASKLEVLLPGFRSANEEAQRLDVLGGMTVMSAKYFREKTPRKQLYLGITGADDNTIASAGQYRVENFLKLQPMDWQVPSELMIGSQKVPLDSLRLMGAVFEEPGFAQLETHLAEMGQVSGLSEKVEGLRHILTLPEQKFELMPIYGMHREGVEKMALLVKVLRRMQVSGIGAGAGAGSGLGKKSIVLPVITDLNQRELVQLKSILPSHSVHIGSISDPATLERLSDPRPGEIVIVMTGAVTQSIFNLLFARATLPATVAGKNATHLMHQLGKPYLNTIGTLPVSKLAGSDKEASGGMARAFQIFAQAHFATEQDVVAIADFIAESKKADSPTRRLFLRFKEESSGLSHDKVFQGLLQLRKHAFSPPVSVRPRPVSCLQIFGG